MCLVLVGCSDEGEDTIPVNPAFEIELSNNLAPSEVTIINNTSGATSFNWTFIGGKPENSPLEKPPVISYPTAGEYTITLQASNGLESRSKTQTFTLPANAIISYKEVQLGGVNLQSTMGCVFSTSLGRVIKSTEISPENGASIDIVYVGISGFQFFESPQGATFWNLTEIPNATITSFTNYLEGSEINFTVEDFDNLVDDTLLRDLNIVNDSTVLYLNFELPPRVALFKNSLGKKGAIKITDFVPGPSGSITFDLKIQQ